MDLQNAVVKEEVVEVIEGVETPEPKRFLETPDVKIEYESDLIKEMAWIDASIADFMLRKETVQAKLDKFKV